MCGGVLFLKIFIHESSLEALPCLAHNYFINFPNTDL